MYFLFSFFPVAQQLATGGECGEESASVVEAVFALHDLSREGRGDGLRWQRGDAVAVFHEWTK